jgi:hypothetical protein
MRHKALVISFYFPPLNGPGIQHGLWFFDFMPEFGVETNALTTSVYFPQETPDSLPVPNIIRVPQTRRRPLWRRVFKTELSIQLLLGEWEPGFLWSEFAVRAARRRLKSEPFSALVSVSPSMASHWTAYRLKKRFPHLKWIADFQDPFLGNPFHFSKPFIHPLERRLERAIFSTADYLSANTNTVQAMWRERYPEFHDKFVVTWGGYDPGEAVTSFSLPPRDAPVLCHTGVIYGTRIPNALFSSLDRLLTSGRVRPSDLVLELVGVHNFNNLTAREELDRLRQQGIVRIREGHIPRDAALRAAGEANYLLLLDITGSHHAKLQVPSKLFDYIRIGRPILAFTPEGSPTEYILSRSGIPYSVIDTRATPETVDEKLLQFLALPSEPQPPSDWFLETFNARHLARSIADLIKR